MQYYHDTITEKSWEMLQRLTREISFVLIGGWATYLYTKTLKSKDIDIIIDYDELMVLKKNYDCVKNDRLHKYEARSGMIQIDIYLPYYSQLGIPVETLLQHTQKKDGFTLLDPHYLFVLKLYALSQRGRSVKGHKDFIDLIALFQAKRISLEKIKERVSHDALDHSRRYFLQYLTEYTKLPELSLNSHSFAPLKKQLQSL